MPKRRLATSLVALLILFGATACSDDPEPKIADPTDEAFSETASATTPPTSPSTSLPPERESAERFLRRWQAAGDEMQRTGETAEYQTLNKGCDSCAAFVNAIEEVYQSGGSVEFAGTDISRLIEVATSRRAATYDLEIASSETITYDSAGAITSRFPPERVTLHVTLLRDARSWLVTSFSKLPES